MWQKLALNLVATILLLSVCSPSNRQAVDKLNSLSYAYHYRDLDTVVHYANIAFNLSDNYPDGQAEALNNLAFVYIIRMQYDKADSLLRYIPQLTDNHIELLVAYVQQMRLCQRRSHNREFYDYRMKASQSLARIEEDTNILNEHETHRLNYAKSEMSLVTSTYYYYVGLERQSIQAMDEISIDLESDTAQYLNYLYNIGAGGVINQGTQNEINEKEIVYLTRCYELAREGQYTFFMANSLEGLAEHHLDEYYAPALADSALNLFCKYGDVYQIAGAYRTLASCYWAQQNYEQALTSLEKALSDTIINQAPDLVASICEQLSVVYAAINNKKNSDLNRNRYLDLQEQTRQDRYLEARAGQLEYQLSQLNNLLIVISVLIAIVVIFIVIQYYRRLLRQRRREFVEEDEIINEEEDIHEQINIAKLRCENEQRVLLEHRAKISLVNSITPLIDRILHSIRLSKDNIDKDTITYINELTQQIEKDNDVLTNWIKLRQGELILHIESFPLQEIFNIVAKSEMGFKMKHVHLNIVSTDAIVKADKILTVFMLNTLADNARKFTRGGDTVTIYSETNDDYVEISIKDTGIGMDDSTASHIFEHKIEGGHGYGLVNCKGIIEKYRKTSKIFNVCTINCESTKGEGSRFFFRLPKGIMKMAGRGFSLLLFGVAFLMSQQISAMNPIEQASIYADSVYFCNINGEYEKALDFAELGRQKINEYYLSIIKQGKDTLMGYSDNAVIPEIRWLHDSIDVNYNVILDIRNESAVAALALHDWKLYYYNNRIYTLLFKELSADATLDDYCKKMQQSQSNKQIAILLLVILLFAILIAIVWHIIVKLNNSAQRQNDIQEKKKIKEDELSRLRYEDSKLYVTNAVLDNCLSSLKHETMYYPGRIRQLLNDGDYKALNDTVAYYREIYGILSEHANRQANEHSTRLTECEHEILANELQLKMLFDLLRRVFKSHFDAISYTPRDNRYIACQVCLKGVSLTDDELKTLFTPSIEHIPLLICKQILRDLGNITNLHGCGIWAERKENIVFINIIFPRVCKTSK